MQFPAPRLSGIAAYFCGALLAAELPAADAPQAAAMAREYCVDCHDADVTKGGLNLAAILDQPVETHADVWETVAHRLRARQMPPAGKRRPQEDEYAALLARLEGSLDAHAVTHPRPGRTETLRRLNRTEYQNAVRDLLAVEIDAAALLPADESSFGFDNVTVGTLPPVLLDRYISAAQKIARLAVGGEQRVPSGDTLRVQPDLTQESRVEGLPFGTRGGALIPYTFPRDGGYDISVRLTRDRNDNVEGVGGRHTMLVFLDGREVQRFEIKPPAKGLHDDVDKHLSFRLQATAGRHDVGVTFLANSDPVLDYKRQPYEAHFNFHRHPRLGPAVFQVSIVGPYDSTGAGDSGSRRRIFTARPKTSADAEPAAKQIIGSLLRRAWRRPVTDADIGRLMPFVREEGSAGFDAGIEAAIGAILVSREFLFRVEDEPAGLAPGTPYTVGDVALASRLSFFLWSSIPDEELLALAGRGELGKPAVLEAQTRRMLADPRAASLARNFAAQWLHLRNLDSITPDGRLFPDFDDNLRQAMRRETEMLFEEMVRGDRSVLSLLDPGYSWMNERLAKHYGVSHVYGPHFRQVALTPDMRRGGIVRHGSTLTVTSYATRTSPVIRGKWILETLIGTPPPPPDPDVPALDDSTVSESLPIRQRLAAHRDKPACAGCHEFIDPPGFALEHYDAVGRWRDHEGGGPVDATGGLPDGSRFEGAEGLEAGLIARPEIFVSTLTGKLLTFALGRGMEPSDGAAIRDVIRRAAARDQRFSEVILGIVNSAPFRMRETARP